MDTEEKSIKVGKSGIKDRKKVEVQGLLITPRKKIETLILVQTGWLSEYFEYEEQFGQFLGCEYHVYITNFRKNGAFEAERSLDDFAQIDKSIRKELKPEYVFYIGHGFGMNVVVGAMNKHNLTPDGLYGICACPSYADTTTHDSNPEHESFAQRVIDTVSGLYPTHFLPLGLGPMELSLKDYYISEPVKFAIGGNDEVLNTNDPAVAQRFISYFSQYPLSSSQIFSGRNHGFNCDNNLTPFNRDESMELILDIRKFITSVLSSEKTKMTSAGKR
ncbi:hypothetical protein J4434_02055 [Candidatus Woesearchaeota archaeon]|nr:hypothetical protein [Candidatus Woesearchaeota archaeon]